MKGGNLPITTLLLSKLYWSKFCIISVLGRMSCLINIFGSWNSAGFQAIYRCHYVSSVITLEYFVLL